MHTCGGSYSSDVCVENVPTNPRWDRGIRLQHSFFAQIIKAKKSVVVKFFSDKGNVLTRDHWDRKRPSSIKRNRGKGVTYAMPSLRLQDISPLMALDIDRLAKIFHSHRPLSA